MVVVVAPGGQIWSHFQKWKIYTEFFDCRYEEPKSTINKKNRREPSTISHQLFCINVAEAGGVSKLLLGLPLQSNLDSANGTDVILEAELALPFFHLSKFGHEN